MMKDLGLPDKPDWPEIEMDWKAGWIWTKEEAGENTYAYFRHAFVLPKGIGSAVCRVTAERSYNLWINERWVGRGPVWGDPRWKTYDIYEVKKHLRVGENVVAILGYYDGLDHLLPHDAPAGILLQIDIEMENKKPLAIYTNVEWKGMKSLAWHIPLADIRLDDISFQERYHANGYADGEAIGWKTVSFDDTRMASMACSQIPTIGWKTVSFDDTSWSRVRFATPQLDTVANYPAATPRHHPWVRLDPRPIAYQETMKRLPGSILRAGEVRELEENTDRSLATRLSIQKIEPFKKARVTKAKALCQSKGGPAVIENSSATESYSTFDGIHAATIVFDFGHLMNARVGFDVEGEEGAAIEIGYAWRLVDGEVIPRISERNYYADRYVLRQGRQSWQTYNWRHFRYVQLTFRGLTRPLKIYSLWAEETMYPLRRRGHFACSNDRLNTIWDMCEKTVRLCTDDRFMDAPGRERKQYTDDLSQILLATYTFFGDLAIVRNYFRVIAQGQEIYGQYRVCNPGRRDDKGLLEASLFFVLRIWEHYQFFGDISLVKEMAPGVWLFLEYCRLAENERGLLEKLACPIWIDWAFIDKRGENLVINALYSKVLLSWGDLYQELGEVDKAKSCKKRGGHIRRILPDYFWDEGQKSFMDSKLGANLSSYKSEHSQAAALLWADIPKDRFEKAVKTWEKDPDSFSRAEPLFMYLPFALAKYQRVDLALKIIEERFNLFIREGLETVAETWCLLGEKTLGKWRARASRAVAHGSSVWPAFFFMNQVLGIQPGAPGFKMVRVYPQLGKLKWAKGKFPTNFGDIEVNVATQDRRWKISVKLPQPRPLEVGIPFKPSSIKKIFLNKKPVDGLLSKEERGGSLICCLSLPETKRCTFNIEVLLS